jgi:phosphotriesterase-related protein
MEILEQEGLDLHRFIWVHAQVEAREVEHLEAVRRGAYIEFDSVGAPFQDQNILLAYTLALVNAGYAEHILVSHDAGWYDPSQPDGLPPGDGIRGYTGLIDSFIPALRTRGLSEEMIRLLTHTNPARAFGMEAI